jgi:hypothetical protein
MTNNPQTPDLTITPQLPSLRTTPFEEGLVQRYRVSMSTGSQFLHKRKRRLLDDPNDGF